MLTSLWMRPRLWTTVFLWTYTLWYRYNHTGKIVAERKTESCGVQCESSSIWICLIRILSLSSYSFQFFFCLFCLADRITFWLQCKSQSRNQKIVNHLVKKQSVLYCIAWVSSMHAWPASIPEMSYFGTHGYPLQKKARRWMRCDGFLPKKRDGEEHGTMLMFSNEWKSKSLTIQP